MDEKTRLSAKSSGRKFIEILLVLSVLSIAWAIFTPLKNRSSQHARRMTCQSNLKRIMLSVQQYLGDYDEKYPLVASGAEAGGYSTFGWVDTLFPYGNMTSVRLFQCPSEQTDLTKNDAPSFQTEGLQNLQNQQKFAFSEDDPTQPQFTDYWLNARLAGKRQSELADGKRTIALGEGNDGADLTNARYQLLEIPQRWLKDEKSPLYRHLDGANFAFADGHVKFIRPNYSIGVINWRDGLDAGDSTGATFRLKPKNKPAIQHKLEEARKGNSNG